MDNKNLIIKFVEKFTSDESSIKRIPKYFFLIVILLIIIAIEIHQTNAKLDTIINNNIEEKKQMVVEVFSEEERTPSDYMPILDETITDDTSTETTTIETTTKPASSGNTSNEQTTNKTEPTNKTDNTAQTQQENTSRTTKYVLNINSKKVHSPDCSSAARTKEENKKTVNLTVDELQKYLDDGYEFCKICGGN